MAYASEVLADSPYRYWKLDEPSGSTAADSSGNGANIAYANAPTYRAAGPGSNIPYAIEASGTDVCYTAGLKGFDSAASAISLEAWIYPTAVNFYVAGDRDSEFNDGFQAYIDGSQKLTVLRLNGGSGTWSDSVNFPLNTWTHLVLVMTGSELRVLYNGVYYGGTASSVTLPTWSSGRSFRIGHHDNGSLALRGRIAQVATYNQALSDARAAAHYAAGSASSVNLPLTPATVTVTPVAPAVSLGTASVPLSPATVTVTPQTLAANAGIVVPLSPATITVTPQALARTLSGVDVALTPATVTVTPQALGIDGNITLALTPATIIVTPQPMAPTAPSAISLGTAESAATVGGVRVTTAGHVDPDWSFTIHDPLNGDLKATISTALEGSGWEDVWSDVGSGVLKLAADDTAVADVARGDVVRCTYKGANAFQWRATRSVLDDNDDTAGILTWSGPGRLADLSGARIAPSRGFGAQPVEEVRSFGWPSVDYDDTTWTTSSVAIVDQGTKTDWWYGLADWPDPTAEWMWSPGAAVNWSRTGDVYFRTTFTVDGPGWHTIYLAVDDRGALWIDGQRLLTTQSWDNSNNSIVTAKVVLSAGEHTLAVWGQNNDGQPGNNPAGVLVSVMPEGGGGSIFNSGAGWKCFPYPLVPPGVTFGSVLVTLIEEVRDRALLLTGLDYTFTAETDSNGEPWPWLDDVTAKVGSDMWSLIKAHVGTDCQVHMPGGAYRLDMYVPDGGGPERPVTFDHPTDDTDPLSGELVGRTVTGEGVIATAAHVRWDGGWLYVDTTQPGEERQETVLELRHLTSVTDADRVARGILADLGRVREQIEVAIAPVDSLPWHHWWAGDLLTARDTAGSLVTERVVGIAATIRGDDIDVTPTLKDRIAETLERHEEWLKTMSDGASRGNTTATTPPSLPPPSLPPRAREKLTWSIPRWAPFTGGVHDFEGRITTVTWRLKMSAPVTGTVTSTLRYEGGATIATVTLTAGQQEGQVVAMEVVDNGQSVEWVTTGTEAFDGNATLEYLT